jgi:hypothetical protein
MGVRQWHLAAGLAALSAVAFSSLTQAATAGADTADGRWHFNLVPYLWLPVVEGSIDTDVALPGPSGGDLRQVKVNGSIDPSSYLSDLNMAFMILGEARKDRWLIYTDVLYADLGSQDTRVRSVTGPLGDFSTEVARNATTDISSVLWTLGAGYELVREPSWSLSVVAGFRYLGMESDLTLSLQDERGRYLRALSVSTDEDYWDGIIGARGQILFESTRWFMPFYADIGTGSSDLTWQALLGLGYRFDWGEATFAWRAIGYEFDGDNVDITFNGPGLGVGFRW